MGIRNSERPACSIAWSQVGPNFGFGFSIFVLWLLLLGCASPGEPVERKPPAPAAIADLAVEQYGNSTELTFTLPRETVEHRLLKHPPDIEIYRDFSSAAAGPATANPPSSAPLLVTIPSALVSHYEQQGRIRYVDEWTSAVLQQHAGELAVYMVRTRASGKKSSPDSNIASQPVDPVPEPIRDLKAELARAAVRLTWTAPEQTPGGPAPPVRIYRIYRAEIAPAVSARKPSSATGTPPFSVEGKQKGAARLTKIGESQSATFEDSTAESGATYEYSVRSVVEYSGTEAESSGSNLATITMRDVFPPAAPTGLLAVFVPREQAAPAHVDLSWSVNLETDVAGYNVYRSEQEGTRGRRLNPELLPTPAFSDMSTVAGQRYFYTVTAVDRTGNESEPSAAFSSEVPAESQP
jgi:hypothetical protein